MKNLVPPSAQSSPKVTAMCMYNFLFSGFIEAKSPETNNGSPNMEGK